MKKSLINRFLNKQQTRKELLDLHEEVNSNKEAVLELLENDWEAFQLEEHFDWPQKHWEQIHNKIPISVSDNHSRSVFRLSWVTKIAAALLVIASVWFAFESEKKDRFLETVEPRLITEANSSDEPTLLILKDGTKVTLTAHSSLSYYNNFNERYRVVLLNGEAYFETDGQNKRPFIVVSDNITSICRGKEFSISAFKESEEINVTLASGQIEISRNDKLNSENNKVAVKSCQRYSFNKRNDEYLIGQISDCEYDEKARSMKEAASKSVVML